MKNYFYALSIMLSCLYLISIPAASLAQEDDPNLDRIPQEFIDAQQNRDPEVSSVVTIDGYDNFYLGVDFAEGHISENPNEVGQYFVAMNTNGTHHTFDGHNWNRINVTFPGYTLRGDPVTAYDSDGVLYYENMYGGPSGCVVKTSTDNGQTWSDAVVAISGVDKNWMCADMTDGPYSNYVYTCMTRSGGGNFSRSTNQGASWQTTFSPGTQSVPGMMVCVGAWGSTDGGAVYVVTNSGGAFSSTYTFYQSLNGGQTFTMKSSQQFSNYVGSNVNGRNSVQNMRTRPYPFIAADNSDGPYRGRLYLVYASNYPAGNGNYSDVFCRYSDDGGATWSDAETVNDDFPTTSNHQWHPAIWCDVETGRLYVQWMDTRESAANTHAKIYGSYSDNGGVSFVPNHAISNEEMKINCTTCPAGGEPRYQGDYNGIVSNSVTSMATWADFRDGKFDSYVAYFPDYAMLVSPDVAQTTGMVATFDAEIPSVKAWTDDVTFTASVQDPPAGSFTVNYPDGNTLSSFPGTLSIEVIADEDVPPGLYEVTIEGAGPNGTPVHRRTAHVDVVPLAPPVADFEASATSICEGEAIDYTDLTTGGVSAWSWTFEGGDPATSTDQNPTGIMYDTPGMYDVTLVSTNSAGSNSITKEDYIEVRVAPGSPTSNDEVVCFGDAVPDLSAQGENIQWYDDEALTNLVHTGATFATGQTDPGLYTYYVTQTSGGCESAYTMVTLTINALPVVGLEEFASVCINEPAFTLSGGTPEGGMYSGTAVSGDMFDPMTAGTGDHIITYTYEDANGCENDTSQVITVFDLPVVTFDALPGVCADDAPLTLSGGMPAGGTYSGTGVSSGMFDPMIAGVGTHTITYDYTDPNGCASSASQDISVNALPQPFIGADTAVCAGQDITLDATTAGGTSYEWYPGGETSATITVDTNGYGIGTHMFVAYVTDGNGCTGADTVMVEFKDCTGIGELAGISDIRLYPNPGQGEFTLQVNTHDPLELNIDIYNNRGVKVFEQEKLMVAGAETIRLNLSNQPSGIYLVNVFNQDGKWIEKLIIRK